MKKRISVLLLMVLIVCNVNIVTARADNDRIQSGDFEYIILEDNTASIVTYLVSASISSKPQKSPINSSFFSHNMV